MFWMKKDIDTDFEGADAEDAEDEEREASLRKLHDVAMKRFRDADEADRDDRTKAEEDLRFLNGEQWPEGNRRERELEGLPCLTSNRLPQFVEQIVGDQRQNRPGIEVRPDGDDDDPEAAKIIEGIIRSINARSIPIADTAIDNAMEGASSCGRGFFRVLNKYVDEESFDQELVIKRIGNHFSVYWDPGSTEIDFTDARYLFVTELLSTGDFEEKYPGKTATGIPGSTGDSGTTGGGKFVRIAEYWFREPGPERMIYQLADGTVTNDEPADGAEILNTRRVKTEKIQWCIISGADILEGPEEWPGKYFPIIPVWGKEILLDGKRQTRGVIRFAKDDQRMLNYAKSVKAEMLIQAPKTPWILTKKMIDGVASLWNMAHTRRLPYLTYTPDPAQPRGPYRTEPIQVQTGAEVEVQEAVEGMKATTGIYDSSLGNKSNETSGRAILLRQRQGDTATYSYIDNLSRSLTHLGYVIIDLIPKIYTGERVLQIVDVDGTAQRVAVNTPVFLHPDTGEIMDESAFIADPNLEPVKAILNNLTRGKYQVTVTTGPSFATRRMEAAEIMMQFTEKVPAAFPLVADLMVQNMDWPEADRIARRLSVLVPPQAKAAEEGRQLTQEEMMGLAGGLPPQGMPGGKR